MAQHKRLGKKGLHIAKPQDNLPTRVSGLKHQLSRREVTLTRLTDGRFPGDLVSDLFRGDLVERRRHAAHQDTHSLDLKWKWRFEIDCLWCEVLAPNAVDRPRNLRFAKGLRTAEDVSRERLYFRCDADVFGTRSVPEIQSDKASEPGDRDDPASVAAEDRFCQTLRLEADLARKSRSSPQEKSLKLTANRGEVKNLPGVG
jgi:hypothetical protein